MRNFIRWVTGKPYTPSPEVQSGRDDLEETKRRLDAIDRHMHQIEHGGRDETGIHIYRDLIERRQGTRRHATT